MEAHNAAQHLDDWALEEQRRERKSQAVITAVVLALLGLGTYMILQMLQRV